MTRTILAGGMLVGLLIILYSLWPRETIDALWNDPDVVLRMPWEDVEPSAKSQSSPSAEPSAPSPSEPALHVLFVGNSHTYYNGMPDMVAALASAADEALAFAPSVEAPGGATLDQHLKAGRVAERLTTGRWDYVVLQEQQQWPSFAQQQREREFYVPARTLDVMIRAVGAKTVFFATWARRDGDRDNRPDDTYAAMQARTLEGYAEIVQELGARIAPVGIAWQSAHTLRPELSLWAPDGSHASPLGSYLAACVFYATFYGRSPEGNPFTAGLNPSDAAFLQRAAARTLRNPAH